MSGQPAEADAPKTAERAVPAVETVRLYRADWRAFEIWCAAEDRTALPATPDTVARFLAAVPGLSAGTLARRAAAIAAQHRQRGLAAPTEDPAVTARLRQARRAATSMHPKSLRPPQLIRMALSCPRDLAGLRDRALLLLAAAVPGRTGPGRPALGRVALVGLAVEQLRFTATGVALTLPADDRTGVAARCLVVPSSDRPGGCPVQALLAWLRASDTRFGPVFRKVDRWGTIEHTRLGGDAVRDILLSRAKAAKLTVHGSERLSPHGLRAGFVTEAYLAGARDEQVMDHTRHRDLKTMRGYVRRAKLVTDSATKLLDL